MSMDTIVPAGDTVKVIRGCEDGTVRSSRGEDGHDGKSTRSCEVFDLWTPTSYTITEYPRGFHRTRHGPMELRRPYLRPTSSEFQNDHSMDLICVFSIFIFNPLITPNFLLSLCHPLFEPSHLIPIFAIVTCLSFILVLENAPIGSMLRTRVLTHIPSYLIFIVLLSLSSRLRNAGSL